MTQHAVLSPSGAETWEGCAKSAAMQKGRPNDANEYTDEGTAAHLLGARCLEEGTNPLDYEGNVIHVGGDTASGWDGAVWGEDHGPTFNIRRTYTVDDEMVAAVSTYVDSVRESAGESPIRSEARYSVAHITGEADAAGTADAVVVRDGELQVHDLKYGMGVRVEAEGNKQLMLYAHAVKEELEITDGPFTRVRLVIHQPRISVAPSEWDCTVEELDAYIAQLKPKAEMALAYYECAEEVQAQAAQAFGHLMLGTPLPAAKLEVTLRDFGPTEDACRWCRAKAECPALVKVAQDAAGVDFAVEPPDRPAVPDDYTALGKLFRWVPFFEMFGKAVRAKAEAALFEHGNDPEVSAQLGLKLVEGKRGNRQWGDEAKAEDLLKAMRMTLEERYNLKLKSPPQLEKVLKESPRRWKRVLDADLIVQKDGQPSVAPLEDKRPAWVPPDSAADFQPSEEVT